MHDMHGHVTPATEHVESTGFTIALKVECPAKSASHQLKYKQGYLSWFYNAAG